MQAQVCCCDVEDINNEADRLNDWLIDHGNSTQDRLVRVILPRGDLVLVAEDSQRDAIQ